MTEANELAAIVYRELGILVLFNQRPFPAGYILRDGSAILTDGRVGSIECALRIVRDAATNEAERQLTFLSALGCGECLSAYVVEPMD